MTEQDPPNEAVKEFQQILSDRERWKDRALVAEQKLQQAEAAVAEMEMLLDKSDPADSMDEEDRSKWFTWLEHAKGESCGQGWLSPEKAKALTEALERIADFPSGAIVTPDFDEPFSASVAREALAAAKKP